MAIPSRAHQEGVMNHEAHKEARAIVLHNRRLPSDDEERKRAHQRSAKEHDKLDGVCADLAWALVEREGEGGERQARRRDAPFSPNTANVMMRNRQHRMDKKKMTEKDGEERELSVRLDRTLGEVVEAA